MTHLIAKLLLFQKRKNWIATSEAHIFSTFQNQDRNSRFFINASHFPHLSDYFMDFKLQKNNLLHSLCVNNAPFFVSGSFLQQAPEIK